MSEFKLKTDKFARDKLRATQNSLGVGYICDDIDTCLAEIERLRSVLSWYAFTGPDLTEQTSDELWDNSLMLAHQLFNYGQKAREALK